MDSPSPETLEQLRAENQRLRARIAALEVGGPPAPSIISGVASAPPIWFDVISDAIYVIDASRQILYWNRAAEQIYGWPRAEAIGRLITEVIAVVRYVGGESGVSVLSALKTVGSWRGEVIHRTRDGHEVMVGSSLYVDTDAQGVITRCLGIHRDTIARVRAEESLRVAYAQADAHARSATEYAARLDSLLSHASIGIALLDTELRYQHINAHLATMNGATPEAHLGRTIREALPELAPEIEGIFHQVLSTGEPMLNIEICGTIPANPGVSFICLSSYFPVRDADGNICGLGGVVIDITKQRLAEQALQIEYQQTAAILHALDEGVIAIRADGPLAAINPSARQLMFGELAVTPKTVHDVAAMSQMVLLDADGQLVAPEDWPYMRVLRNERFRNWDVRLRLPGVSEDRWATISGVTVHNPDGSLALGIVTQRDITERKQAEAAAQVYAEALNRVNVELTRVLRLKDAFLAMMSHELRTPMHGILSFAETLAEQAVGPLNARQIRSVQHITASGQHLLALINDMLDLSKLESGRMNVYIEPHNVIEICEASLRYIQPIAVHKGVHVRFINSAPAMQLEVDAKRLTQMLVNLLNNAVKFTPVGGQVRLELVADIAREQVAFIVEDTGIGIAAEDMGQLFQPFTQIDNRLARQHEGTGLGLALVRRIVDMLGGSVHVESAGRGLGSRFMLVLPWSPVVPERIAPSGGESAALVHTQHAQGMQILLAEESEVAIRTLITYLQHLRHQVVVVHNGQELIADAIASQPDLILMNIHVPGRDGLTSIRQLRELPLLTTTPIIVLTAQAMPGDRERCLEAGANAYLTKPVGLRALITTITSVLAPTRVGDDP